MIALRSARPSPRRGFGLIELAAAGALFAAVVAITLQLIGWMANERRTVHQREVAARTVGNVMERILARTWPMITDEAIAALVVEHNRAATRTSGRLRVAVVPEASLEGVLVKKVVVEVAWPDLARVPEAPVRLIAWTYQRSEQP